MSTSPTPWSAGRSSARLPASGFAGCFDAQRIGCLRLLTPVVHRTCQALGAIMARRLALHAGSELARLDDRVLADMGLERALLLAALGMLTHRLVRRPREG